MRHWIVVQVNIFQIDALLPAYLASVGIRLEPSYPCKLLATP